MELRKQVLIIFVTMTGFAFGLGFAVVIARFVAYLVYGR